MNLYVARFGKYYIHRRGEFWTGTGWTNVAQFGRPYRFRDALAITERRFHRMRPVPTVRRCTDFHKKPKKYGDKADDTDD